jgi:hypothetical protein
VKRANAILDDVGPDSEKPHPMVMARLGEESEYKGLGAFLEFLHEFETDTSIVT